MRTTKLIISITDGSEMVKSVLLYNPHGISIPEVERTLRRHYTEEEKVWDLVYYGNLYHLKAEPVQCNYVSDYLDTDPVDDWEAQEQTISEMVRQVEFGGCDAGYMFDNGVWHKVVVSTVNDFTSAEWTELPSVCPFWKKKRRSFRRAIEWVERHINRFYQVVLDHEKQTI